MLKFVFVFFCFFKRTKNKPELLLLLLLKFLSLLDETSDEAFNDLHVLIRGAFNDI